MSLASAEITYREAIRLGLRDAMRADPAVVLLGEDIGVAGGPFKVTEGLVSEFGADRVMDTPISETGFVGAAIGLALAGYRPVAELMFADFAAVAWDQIVNQAAKYRYLSAGQMSLPMVIRCGGGAGARFAAQHSQTTESWYLSVPGLKVVVPATPQDAYDLLRAAVEDPDPVVYIEHKALYASTGPCDVCRRTATIGAADIVRPGRDVTVVATLAMVPRTLAAATSLASTGIEVEVIDLRSLAPLDLAAVVGSVRRTGRLVTVEEQPVSGGWGGNLAAAVASEAFDALDAPPMRLGLPEAPMPFSPILEDAAVPSPERIAEAIRDLVR